MSEFFKKTIKFIPFFSKDEGDIFWFSTKASKKSRKKILEDIVEKSSQDQKDIIEEYKKRKSKISA